MKITCIMLLRKRQHSTMDSAAQKLTLAISKDKQQIMDPTSWKLIGEETLISIDTILPVVSLFSSEE